MSNPKASCRIFLAVGALAMFGAISALAAPSTISINPELDALLAGRDVVFIARELDGDQLHALDSERINERHPPFSTFKIPNFLIALETGVIADANAVWEWDADSRPPTDFWPETWK